MTHTHLVSITTLHGSGLLRFQEHFLVCLEDVKSKTEESLKLFGHIRGITDQGLVLQNNRLFSNSLAPGLLGVFRV